MVAHSAPEDQQGLIRPNPFRPATMNARLCGVLLLFSTFTGAAALAAAPARAAAPVISPAQQEAIFAEQKQLVLRDQLDRRQAIETAARCVKAASTSTALMGCLVQEHQQSQRISADHHAAMLAILNRHGIHPLQPSPSTPASTKP